MKKTFLSLGIIGLSTLALAGCGNQQKKETKTDATPKTEHKVKKEKSDVTSNSDETSKTSSEAESNVSSMASSVQSTAQTEQVSNKQLGTIVGFLTFPDWFKDGINNGGMYYGTVTKDSGSNPGPMGDLQGYNYISAHGDGASFVYYKRNGDTVTIKYSDAGADGAVHTREVSYQNLLNDYYQNQDQKNEVNTDTNKMKDDPNGYM